MTNSIPQSLFRAQYRRTNESKEAIFTGRKALMEELYATGIPIYCDMSYYVTCQELYQVVKNGEHFECNCYKKFEEWRDCHYYTLYENFEGNKIWLMTGGKYD